MCPGDWLGCATAVKQLPRVEDPNSLLQGMDEAGLPKAVTMTCGRGWITPRLKGCHGRTSCSCPLKMPNEMERSPWTSCMAGRRLILGRWLMVAATTVLPLSSVPKMRLTVGRCASKSTWGRLVSDASCTSVLALTLLSDSEADRLLGKVSWLEAALALGEAPDSRTPPSAEPHLPHKHPLLMTTFCLDLPSVHCYTTPKSPI